MSDLERDEPSNAEQSPETPAQTASPRGDELLALLQAHGLKTYSVTSRILFQVCGLLVASAIIALIWAADGVAETFLFAAVIVALLAALFGARHQRKLARFFVEHFSKR